MFDTKEISQILLPDIKKGNQTAFKKLFDLYCEKLVYFSFNIIRDQESAENIVQDTFLHIWENRTELDVTKSLKTYLYAIVKNRSLKFIRHNDVKSKHESDLQLIYSKNSSLENTLENQEISEQINNAIDKLPPKCREIFLMSRSDGLKYKEIAELNDISVKTVENQMSKALKSLRDYLSHLITILIIFYRGF